jgi:phage host-nuclease inhibitor protein Gam
MDTIEQKVDTHADTAIPQNTGDVETILRQIRKNLRRIEQATARRDKAVARIEARENVLIATLESEAVRNAEAVYAYAEAHKNELTDNGKRESFPGRSGTLQWHKVTGIVTLTIPEQDCIANLERRRMNQFVTVKKSLKRSAIRDQRELFVKKKVPGIAFKDSQLFTIKPAGNGGTIKRDTSDPDSWETSFPKKK